MTLKEMEACSKRLHDYAAQTIDATVQLQAAQVTHAVPDLQPLLIESAIKLLQANICLQKYIEVFKGDLSK